MVVFYNSLGWRMALATASTAAIMARTCTVPCTGQHHPGLMFISGLLGWEKVLFQGIETILVLTLLGVVIHNLHLNRSYPTFWMGLDDVSCVTNRNRENNASESDGIEESIVLTGRSLGQQGDSETKTVVCVCTSRNRNETAKALGVAWIVIFSCTIVQSSTGLCRGNGA